VWLHRQALPILAVTLLVVVPALTWLGVLNLSDVSQLGRYSALALVAIGLDLVWGYTGVLSLCQALFFTLGGYAMGMYMCMHGQMDAQTGTIPMQLFVVTSDPNLTLPWFWEPFAHGWFAALMVLLLPALAAFLIGWFAFRSRIKGVYFSIITQAITIAAVLMFNRNDLMLCGTNGLSGITMIGSFDMREPSMKMAMYVITVIVMLGAIAMALWLTRTRFGRILVAIRDNESRVRFTGLSPVRYKTAVFVIAAVLAGIGGALYAPQTGNINPANMAAIESIWVVVWVAVGGRGTITGAVLGCLFIKILESRLTTYIPDYWMAIIGSIFVAVVLWMPDGLVGQARRLRALAQPRTP
jgi:urea transport system permease protein